MTHLTYKTPQGQSQNLILHLSSPRPGNVPSETPPPGPPSSLDQQHRGKLQLLLLQNCNSFSCTQTSGIWAVHFNDMVCVCVCVCVLVTQLCPTLCDSMDYIARQAPLSMEFSRQEYWSGLPFPSPGDLPKQRWNPGLLHCRQILYRLSHQGSPMTCYLVVKTDWHFYHCSFMYAVFILPTKSKVFWWQRPL